MTTPGRNDPLFFSHTITPPTNTSGNHSLMSRKAAGIQIKNRSQRQIKFKVDSIPSSKVKYIYNDGTILTGLEPQEDNNVAEKNKPVYLEENKRRLGGQSGRRGHYAKLAVDSWLNTIAASVSRPPVEILPEILIGKKSKAKTRSINRQSNKPCSTDEGSDIRLPPQIAQRSRKSILADFAMVRPSKPLELAETEPNVGILGEGKTRRSKSPRTVTSRWRLPVNQNSHDIQRPLSQTRRTVRSQKEVNDSSQSKAADDTDPTYNSKHPDTRPTRYVPKTTRSINRRQHFINGLPTANDTHRVQNIYRSVSERIPYRDGDKLPRIDTSAIVSKNKQIQYESQYKRERNSSISDIQGKYEQNALHPRQASEVSVNNGGNFIAYEKGTDTAFISLDSSEYSEPSQQLSQRRRKRRQCPGVPRQWLPQRISTIESRGTQVDSSIGLYVEMENCRPSSTIHTIEAEFPIPSRRRDFKATNSLTCMEDFCLEPGYARAAAAAVVPHGAAAALAGVNTANTVQSTSTSRMSNRVMRMISQSKSMNQLKTNGYRELHGTMLPHLHSGQRTTWGDFNAKKFEYFKEALRRAVDPGDPRPLLQEIDTIGEGSTSVVCLARLSLMSFNSLSAFGNPKMTIDVAVKKMSIANQHRPELLMNEAVIMRTFTHPNIVEMLASYIVGDELWVIMEHMDCGALTSILTQTRLKEDQIAALSIPILSALAFLHSQGVIHRDIKSDSILLSSDGKVKLSDFGFCGIISADFPRRSSLVGTPYWMAPEVIKRSPYSTGIDIWSFGVMVIEMIDGEPCLFHKAPSTAMRLIRDSVTPHLRCPGNQSPELRSFLGQMLMRDETHRATAAKLLRHKFLKCFASNSSQDCLRPLLLLRASTLVRAKNSKHALNTSTN